MPDCSSLIVSEETGDYIIEYNSFILNKSKDRTVSVFLVLMIRGVFCIQIIRAAGILIYNRDIIACRNCTD